MKTAEPLSDLHLHLSGATDPVLLWEIICDSGLKTPARTYREFLHAYSANKETVSDHDSYLKLIHSIDLTQSSPSAIEKSVYSAFASSYLAGTQYLELRWNVIKRALSRGDVRIDLDKLILSARAGMERAKSIFGIDGDMILCMGRDNLPEENQVIFNKAAQYFKRGVVGIDVAGPEHEPIQKAHPYLAHFYSTARSLKMVTTIHAGELYHPWTEGELEYIITTLQPQRIGHGVQLYRFPRLMQEMAKRGITLEVCPTSNLVTKALSGREELKEVFTKLREHQVNYMISTDATFLLQTTLVKEIALHDELMGS
jgi:adenosine deaminase